MNLPISTFYAIMLVLDPAAGTNYNFQRADVLVNKYYFRWWQPNF